MFVRRLCSRSAGSAFAPAAITVLVAITVLTVIVLGWLLGSPRSTPSTRASPPTTGAAATTSTQAPGQSAVPSADSTAAPGSSVDLCTLLSLAAMADPARQYADQRSSHDIDAVAVLQQDVLLAAAELLEPGPERDTLMALAEIFVGAGRWRDEQWAEALMTRADDDVVSILVLLESRC